MTLQLVLLTSTRTPTKRFNGSETVNRAGVPFWDAMSGLWIVLPAGYPTGFGKHQRRVHETRGRVPCIGGLGGEFIIALI